MSEYQYYEFLALDQPLTDKQMLEVRSFSTRARITPTSFVNEYHWGNFKGNIDIIRTPAAAPAAKPQAVATPKPATAGSEGSR